MISKNRIKLIRSLERKKERIEHQLFVAEGPRLVDELLASCRPVYVAATRRWLDEHRGLRLHEMAGVSGIDEVTDAELERASLLRSPQQVVALFALPHSSGSLGEVAARELCLVLDGVQDPGNVGTIVRLADWFGIAHVFCSHETCDIFSPKAVQATMGAVARVQVHYVDIVEALQRCDAPIYVTHLHGTDLYKETLTTHGVIVMGNEGKGVSDAVSELANRRLLIPPFPADRQKVESLNVAIATAVVCSEFRRQAVCRG
ncbi:MAG: RNA methyltransferase [Bacteroidales bacterium]|nr:RNA methyltransferase [Candidatus Physcousia equi]